VSSKRVGQATIELVEGDITRVAADAIVNAANEALMPGGGVDGAIHRASGVPVEERLRVAPCPTGQARATSAGRLQARHIIHTVGPVWHDGGRGEAGLLASAYRSSLALAEDLGARSVAFPSISTGIFGYPIDQAARVALGVVAEHLRGGGGLERVTFVLFGQQAYSAYEAALRELGG
jgi:O-acetyl-ADP-ribose deacetylase (regulator of RNase III)